MMEQLRKTGLNSSTLYFASLASVGLSIAIWFIQRRAEDRAAAERFGIFVGLWAPTLMIMGKAIEDSERAVPEVEGGILD